MTLTVTTVGWGSVLQTITVPLWVPDTCTKLQETDGSTFRNHRVAVTVFL